MRPAVEPAAVPAGSAGDPLRHVFEPVAGRCRRLRACALAGALHGRRAPAADIDRAILEGRVRFHGALSGLGRRARFDAAKAYLSTLNL